MCGNPGSPAQRPEESPLVVAPDRYTCYSLVVTVNQEKKARQEYEAQIAFLERKVAVLTAGATFATLARRVLASDELAEAA